MEVIQLLFDILPKKIDITSCIYFSISWHPKLNELKVIVRLKQWDKCKNKYFTICFRNLNENDYLILTIKHYINDINFN